MELVEAEAGALDPGSVSSDCGKIGDNNIVNTAHMESISYKKVFRIFFIKAQIFVYVKIRHSGSGAR